MGCMEKNIDLVRGDTLAFGLELDGIDTLSAASFTVKRTIDDSPVIQKTIGDGISKISAGRYRVRVAPEDTQSLDSGYYIYDFEIQANSDVFTLLRGLLNLLQDVSVPEDSSDE